MNTTNIHETNLLLDSIFNKYGLYLIKKKFNSFQYTKFGDETSYFDIEILNDKINVCVPIKNSSFQFNTSFDDFIGAITYVENRLIDYVQ